MVHQEISNFKSQIVAGNLRSVLIIIFNRSICMAHTTSQNLKQQINLQKLRTLLQNIDPRIKEKKMDNVFMYKLSTKIVCVFNQYLDSTCIAFPSRQQAKSIQRTFDFSERDAVDWNHIKELVMMQLIEQP